MDCRRGTRHSKSLNRGFVWLIPFGKKKKKMGTHQGLDPKLWGKGTHIEEAMPQFPHS